MTKILSLGAGVNSIALLVLRVQGKVDFDVVLFADTGGEHPETYHYIEEIVKPLCQKIGVKFVLTKRDGESLYDYYFHEQIIPTRIRAHCRDKFKITPLRKWAIQNCENPQFLIGFCKGEEKRAENFCKMDNVTFPLIELGIDRDGCKQIIRDYGLPIPIKSGCFFCPYTKVRNWKWLRRTHPDLFQKAIALERNCMRYPELTLHQGAPLEKVIKKREMCDYFDESCSLCEVE